MSSIAAGGNQFGTIFGEETAESCVPPRNTIRIALGSRVFAGIDDHTWIAKANNPFPIRTRNHIPKIITCVKSFTNRCKITTVRKDGDSTGVHFRKVIPCWRSIVWRLSCRIRAENDGKQKQSNYLHGAKNCGVIDRKKPSVVSVPSSE